MHFVRSKPLYELYKHSLFAIAEHTLTAFFECRTALGTAWLVGVCILGKFTRRNIMLVYLCKFCVAHIILLRKLAYTAVVTVYIRHAQHRTADKLLYFYCLYLLHIILPCRLVVIIYRELFLCCGKVSVYAFCIAVYIKRERKTHAVLVHSLRDRQFKIHIYSSFPKKAVISDEQLQLLKA